MKISEIITDKYKLRIPPTVYYDLLADVQEVEEEEEPKTGKWIEHFDESGKWYECDQCHTDWGGPVNFCPNCGADMRGEK